MTLGPWLRRPRAPAAVPVAVVEMSFQTTWGSSSTPRARASTTSVRSPGVPSAPAAGTLPTAQLTGPPVKLVPAGSGTVTVPPSTGAEP